MHLVFKVFTLKTCLNQSGYIIVGRLTKLNK